MLIGIAATLLLATTDVTAGRPEVVLFLGDDPGWADCSPYGGKVVPTPNMERVAGDGMTFTHTFVASPSCVPSRAALLTGLDPMRNGAMLNHTRPRQGIKLWPSYFQGLGYEVVAIGKVERAKADPAAAAVVARYHRRPAEELYDLKADPWELKNVADDPANAATLGALRRDLDAWMVAQGDEGMATERKIRSGKDKD